MVVSVQETKLTKKAKTPKIQGYTSVRLDRHRGPGGGLLTFIQEHIKFTDVELPQIDQSKTETLTIKIHSNPPIHIANIYIPPRSSSNEEDDRAVQNCIQSVLNLQNPLIFADANAHSFIWHSPYEDNRGIRIAELVADSNSIIINTDSPTRIPCNLHGQGQQPTSPDITAIPSVYFSNSTWRTLTELSSDHLPILTTIEGEHELDRTHGRTTFTNYGKADWLGFTAYIESALENVLSENVHVLNSLIVKAIRGADKKFIPKGNLKKHIKPLPLHIRNMIVDRNNARAADPDHHSLRELNDNITKEISAYRRNLWKQHISGDWSHRRNTSTYWRTIKGLQGKREQPENNRTITFNNKIAITDRQIAMGFNKQYTNPVPKSTNQSHRHLNRQLHKLPSSPITITEAQVATAIRENNPSKATGPDEISPIHLKHLGNTALKLLTKCFNIAINSNTIPHMWKLAKLIPIIKPNKNKNQGTSYRPIALLSPIAKTLEKVLHAIIQPHIPSVHHQHGFKKLHSTTTALHTLNDTIASGFNHKQPPLRTVTVALDLSKAFETIDLHILLQKLMNLTSIPNGIIKFIANYTRGRKGYTMYNEVRSPQRNFHCGVPQGGVLSPSLFNLYMSDLPVPTSDSVKVIAYADDITIASSHVNFRRAESLAQPYLNTITDWLLVNKLILNPDKTQTTLFSPDPAEYSKKLELKIGNSILETVKHPKILGLTFDPKLNYGEHIKLTKQKAANSANIYKALASTPWGKHKETITHTYSSITRPQLEYACTIWGPIASSTNFTKLQTIQNGILRLASGNTRDTNQEIIHQETETLPLSQHVRLHSSNLRARAADDSHPLHWAFLAPPPERLMKPTIFHNSGFTYDLHLCNNRDSSLQELRRIKQTIHTQLVADYLSNCRPNPIINMQAPPVNPSELLLERDERRLLCQIRANKSPFLQEYLNKINPVQHPSSLCHKCNDAVHDSAHLFSCSFVATELEPVDLWSRPAEVMALLREWGWSGVSDT